MDIFELFKKIESEKPSGSLPVSHLMVCLGNPGKQYEKTRHNAGFMFSDFLKKKYNIDINKSKYHALCGEAVISGKKVLVMLPQTFMNKSGIAVKEAADFYKISPSNIIVVSDDIMLDVGNMRIRRSGSAGGHNGLKDIIEKLGTDAFLRLRIGVGKKPTPEYDQIGWVLGDIPKNLFPQFAECLERAIPAAELIVDGKIEEAMNKYNTKVN